MTDDTQPRFACDAMLGSLARWLRAAGYDAFWQEGIDDWDLIRLARAEGRILVSCDTGIFRVGIVRDGEVPSLQMPHGLTTREQLALVLEKLGLPVLSPRCMACGGELAEATREQVAGLVPPRSFAWASRFWQCRGCGKPFWEGSHWRNIASVLDGLAARGPEESRQP
jgi:uncharacterized protein with PIN domain